MKHIEGVEVVEGNFIAQNPAEQEVHKNAKYLVVASKWNAMVVDKLVIGAIETLTKFGVSEKNIKVVKVSGAWELPLVIKKILKIDKSYAGIIALGAVIEGGTLHFEIVSSGCNQGLAHLNLEFGIPIGNGVLACRNMEQAIDRAGGKMGNKGAEAALAVLETMNLLNQLEKPLF